MQYTEFNTIDVWLHTLQHFSARIIRNWNHSKLHDRWTFFLNLLLVSGIRLSHTRDILMSSSTGENWSKLVEEKSRIDMVRSLWTMINFSQNKIQCRRNSNESAISSCSRIHFQQCRVWQKSSLASSTKFWWRCICIIALGYRMTNELTLVQTAMNRDSLDIGHSRACGSPHFVAILFFARSTPFVSLAEKIKIQRYVYRCVEPLLVRDRKENRRHDRWTRCSVGESFRPR